MDLQKRMQLAQDLTAGRISIDEISPEEQREAFGTVFTKGEAEGHPFRGNQWTEGKSEGSSWDPKSHPMYTRQDYSYLHDKGYSDKEIKDIWDQDHAEGAKPLTENKNQYQRDKKIKDLTRAYIRSNPSGEGLYEHLASQGFEADEVDEALNQEHQDYSNNKNQKWDPKSHSMFTNQDYSYLHDKGYSDEEIKSFWDRDEADGEKPVTTNKDQSTRDKKLSQVRDKFISQNPDTWDSDTEGGLYSHLEEQGYSAEEIDQTMANLQFGDSGDASLEPGVFNSSNSAYTQASAKASNRRDSEQALYEARQDIEAARKDPKISNTVLALKQAALKDAWRNHEEEYGPIDPHSPFGQAVALNNAKLLATTKPGPSPKAKSKSTRDPFKNMSDLQLRQASQRATSTGHSTAEIKAEQSRRRGAKRSANWKSEREKQIQDIMDAQKLEQDLFLQKIAKIRGE